MTVIHMTATAPAKRAFLARLADADTTVIFAARADGEPVIFANTEAIPVRPAKARAWVLGRFMAALDRLFPRS